MRGLRKGPFLAAVALPALFAVFGAALVGGSGLEWFAGLAKPRFLVALRVFYLVGSLYYVLAAVVLYRILARIDDPRGRAISFGMIVGVLLLNELWNYGFFGLRSTLVGFLGIVVFLALLTALIAALLRYERFSAGLLVPYHVWELERRAAFFAAQVSNRLCYSFVACSSRNHAAVVGYPTYPHVYGLHSKLKLSGYLVL